MRLDPPNFWEDVPSPHPGAPRGPELAPPAPEPPRRRRWRIRHLILALLAIFMLLVAWLAVTAPLSRSLQPIAAPSLTLLSAEGDRCGLAANLSRLLADEALRDRLGRQGRALMAAQFDVLTQTARLEQIYDEVAAAARQEYDVP